MEASEAPAVYVPPTLSEVTNLSPKQFMEKYLARDTQARLDHPFNQEEDVAEVDKFDFGGLPPDVYCVLYSKLSHRDMMRLGRACGFFGMGCLGALRLLDCIGK